MPVKCEQYNQVCVMAVTGDFAAENSVAARKLTEEYIDKRQIVDVVVDLENAGFIDSEGLETLLWIKRKCEDLFGQVKLANLDENCRKIIEITRLEHRFECHPDLAAALKNMR
ncbi:MAG: STAS domain-containing protein [Phycisphaerales bacterium]|jgi:anti-anti-sigma factor|nr:STAS domain-containing protein [Phycisphaerales bacterium]